MTELQMAKFQILVALPEISAKLGQAIAVLEIDIEGPYFI